MLSHILVICFVATVGLTLPLKEENAQIPRDHSVSVRESSKPKDDIVRHSFNSKKNSNEEIMDTASSIVFRPLFAYRQKVAQKRRVYQRRNNNNRRQSNRPQYYYGYPSYMDREFPHVP